MASKFRVSENAMDMLRNGRILAEKESPDSMIKRVVESISKVEKKFSTSRSFVGRFEASFEELLKSGRCVMSTPIMTNAGRYEGKPLSACIVPKINLGNRKMLREEITKIHIDGMGTGFNLDGMENPVSTLRYLNKVAVDSTESGGEDRPVGNIAILSVDSPYIKEFIMAKTEGDKNGEKWKFNISVNATDKFMNAVSKRQNYWLSNGTKVDATEIMDMIARSAHACGDPGLAFMHRFEKDNPTPGLGRYEALAPCGEVGLLSGEFCEFGYMNLNRFLRVKGGLFEIDMEGLRKATGVMIRVLDNALEISINNCELDATKDVMRSRRKIGIGICGLADMLARMGVPYDSKEGRTIATDMVAFINYHSKLESHKLARERGSFPAISGSRYMETPGFLEIRYGEFGTEHVIKRMWTDISNKIRETSLLRNVTTVALPPTGRSAAVIDASFGIEPFFTLSDQNGILNRTLHDELLKLALDKDIIILAGKRGRIGDIEQIPIGTRRAYKTALEINPSSHLKMQAAIQRVVDDGISKTVNLPFDATVDEVRRLYLEAYDMNLKGITIFRDGSRKIQPRKLV